MKKILLIFFLCVILATASAFFWFHSITSTIFIPYGKASSQQSPIQNYFTHKKPFNILLIGYGGGNHDGAYLTDSIVVVHIDPANQQIFLISIPRDIWIKIPTDADTSSYWKINAAYTIGMDDINYPHKKAQFKGADGAGHLVEYVVSQVTGLPIKYFVGMDFSGFKHTIDTLGGVDINVQPAFTDYQYPIEGKETDLCGHQQSEIPTLDAEATQSAVENIYPCRYRTLHFNSGVSHMDGQTALAYVRSRHSLQDGTDFGRAKRQRNLLVAVKKKVYSVGFITQVIPFMASLGVDFKTDLTLNDVKTIIENSQTLNKYQIKTLAVTDQNLLVDTFSSDGQAILEPKGGIDNWAIVHNFLSTALTGKTLPNPAIVQIENGTHIAGLASLAVNRLKNMNVQVIGPSNSASQNTQNTTITAFDKNIKQSDLVLLKKEFAVTKISYTTSNQTKYNVLIIIGNNYNLKEGKKLLNEP